MAHLHIEGCPYCAAPCTPEFHWVRCSNDACGYRGPRGVLDDVGHAEVDAAPAERWFDAADEARLREAVRRHNSLVRRAGFARDVLREVAG